MKNLVLVLSVLFFGAAAFSQGVIRQVQCFDSTLKKEADSLKAGLTADGFVLIREATMTMESEYEIPVVVPLNEGSWYHFVFIGDVTSKLYELRMYDYNEKQVVYVKHFGADKDANIISYSYIPKFSEYHIIKPLQINKIKKNNICGYIMMFKKVK